MDIHEDAEIRLLDVTRTPTRAWALFRFNGNRRFAGDPDPWNDPLNDRDSAP